ncbi:MAG TPA: hypothetical protein PKD79_02900, partial [Candidatus Doudnabacteria bacterium]|nr:hypothetical protein [Candidatus Doudnabacteria bacterium]
IVLLLVIVGLAVRTAFGSTEPVAAKILAGLICLAVATAAVLALFPTQVEAFFIWRNISQAKWSRENASDKLLERPVYKVLERTNLWKVKRKPWGSPELDENGIPKVVPCQIKNSAGQLVSSLEPGEEFITTQVKFKTVDALEVLIPITLRGPDGTWIQPAGLEGNDECLALLSKTTLMFHEQTKANPETGKAFERFSLHLQNLQIPATGPFNTGAYISKGQKVWITATGKVNAMAETEQSSPRYRWVGPSGWASNPEFISGSVGPLLIDEPYMALAATINPISPRIDDGGWVYIGSEKTIEATREGYLFLIVNDRKSQHDVNRDWFNHTQGGFIVEVKVR